MKPLPLLIAGLLLFAPVARAQVIINPAALDQLAGLPPPVIPPPPAIRPAPRTISYRHLRPRRIGIAPRLVSSRVIAKTAPPATPAARPAVQPVVAKPVIPPAPKPRQPLPASIQFAAGGADLPGDAAAALKPFCAQPGIITINAFAAADPSDPSSAARLSMQRAFAIRDALTACGVPSADIIPRANGSAKAATPDAAEVSASP